LSASITQKKQNLTTNMPYKRILLKLSGNLFGSTNESALHLPAVEAIANEIILAHQKGFQIAIVNGAGNIFRGRTRPEQFDPVAADRVGLIATIPNSMALVEMLNSKGVDSRLFSAFAIEGFARHFEPFRARKLLQSGKVVVLTGGTGNTFFTTDTASVVRALEIQADVLLKATDVDGVYSADPHTDPSATKYASLSYQEAIEKKLHIMDQTAFTLAYEHKLPIIVFKFESGSMTKILNDTAMGTLIT
jgi:uridylate kinase